MTKAELVTKINSKLNRMTKDDLERTFSYVEGMCYVRASAKKKPVKKKPVKKKKKKAKKKSSTGTPSRWPHSVSVETPLIIVMTSPS